MASKRSDYYGLYFVPEATAGVDPGLVAAVVAGDFVTGVCTDEVYRFVPESDADFVAFARMAAAPEGLPKHEMQEVPQVFQTNDYDNCVIKDLQSKGEVTLTFNIHGPVLDVTAAPSTGDTSRPVPPPWLQLAGSACGFVAGYRATDAGGAADTVAAAPTDGDTFDVTTGAVAAGLVIAHESPVTDLIDGLARLTAVGSATSITASAYNGTAFGLAATPTAADVVHYPVQAVFDNRLEDASESFTLLLQRPEIDSAILLVGAQAKSWTISATVDTIPTIKITFVYERWSNYDAADTTLWPSEPTLLDEPAYYAAWPCPKITTGAHFWYMDPTDDSAKRDTLDISAVEIAWNSGLDRYMANTGAAGVGAIKQKSKQSLEFKFTCLYNSDFRGFLEACCGVISESFPVYYWEGNEQGSTWFFVMSSAFLKADPGFDGDLEGLQAQQIVLGMKQYTADSGTSDWDGTDFIDTKFALGAF